jgi:tRNA/rRNA methyltransferase
MSFAIVLVDPLRPANVGAAARAMKNFGLADLRLVGGAEVLPGEEGHAEARALAWNAADVLSGARRFPSLAAAVEDLHLVAATSSRGRAGAAPAAPRARAPRAVALGPGLRAGCVFGPEDSGLTNEQLSACTLRVRIPSSGDQPSLNLAQAVVVIAYELAALAAGPPAGPQPLATAGDLDRLCGSFRQLALSAGYLNPQAPEHVLGELRRWVARAHPTEREARLLLGLLAQLRWAVARET